MSNSVRPHRQQPTRLPHPWDSPGKNTGVGCHFLLQCMKVKSETEVAQSCPAVCDSVDCNPPGSPVHGILQVKILEWVAIFCFRGSSQPRDLTSPALAGGFFTSSATRDATRDVETKSNSTVEKPAQYHVILSPIKHMVPGVDESVGKCVMMAGV